MFWLWLLLYGLLFAVPRALMPAAAPLLAVYWAVLLRCLHTRGRLRSYGLCRGRGLTARDALLSLPVLLFAALNIAFGGAWPGAAEAVYLLFAVFGEEVLFRGVLPAVWGEKLGAAGAAAASAALFALLHLGSAVGGSVSAAAVQALCAFGAGLLQTYYRQNNYKPTYVLKGATSLFLEIPFFIAAYAFLSIRLEDTSILDFLRYAIRYFLLGQQTYAWGLCNPSTDRSDRK